ncbi:DVUA0089 family protein [Pseudoduganella buxea]|uniref:PEPxxWA-CTERM sorting domain-containing protein n=1 Tax=Pseudoduganella buxea TaxID=1949069 RepID=A0A6I3T0U3_9BURK|nr:DVUA0089 family protein [Pseudoduganella buxea]MTV54969.1 PEPxxWA-CTERM sorting domain-containing protein [Pseudoduganella buxea]GGC20476.1 hypothetical protein GCM10011572_47350 [Pseudoduganella buxea]
MRFFRKTAAAILCVAAVCTAHADSLDSHIYFHNDVIYHSIILEQASNLTVWTDSWLNGRNFDPIVAVWRNGNLLGQNDDNSSIAPGQTALDSGLRLYGLNAGTYLFTIGMYSNFANGATLGQGFRYDGQAPQAVSIGPFVRLNWDSAPVSSVPEPSTWAMLAAGLMLAGAAARRQRR